MYETLHVPLGLATVTDDGGEADPRQENLYAGVVQDVSSTCYDFVEGDAASKYVVPCVSC